MCTINEIQKKNLDKKLSIFKKTLFFNFDTKNKLWKIHVSTTSPTFKSRNIIWCGHKYIVVEHCYQI